MTSVPPKHSSKLLEGLNRNIQKSSRLKNKVTKKNRLSSQGWKPSSKKTQIDDCEAGSDPDNKSDIISISDEEDVVRSRSPAVSADTELDGSNEACWSECSSVASGPSSRHYAALKPAPSHAVCSTCHKLYQKARRMRAPIKNKLLDKDPNSLSCDQWILLKTLKPRKPTTTTTSSCSEEQKSSENMKIGKLSRIESLKLEQRECGERRRESPTCSRPPIFLQRNLRRCIKKPSRKKERKRKRRRHNTQDSSAAKKQHFQVCNPDQNNCADDSFCSGFGWADRSGQSVDHEAALDLTEEAPSPVSPETSSFTGNQKEPKTKTSFKDLLTQFLCNSSVIVRERH